MNHNSSKQPFGKTYLVSSIVIMMLFFVSGLITFLSQASAVHALTFTVNVSTDAVDNNLGDGVCEIDDITGNLCSLRAAIQEANALAGIDEIIIPSGTITLNRVGNDDNAFAGDLDITDDLIISGAGASTTFVDGGAIDSVFYITNSVSVTISNVTVRNGLAVNGGGIVNDGGVLTVMSTTIRSNQASNNGGGIYISGSNAFVNITNSSLISNSADASGGAIYNSGSLAIMNSTVSTNTAVIAGGGIIQLSGMMTVTNSTLSGNSAANGGGIYNNLSSASLINLTINNNTAPSGAGIAQIAGTMAIKNSIVSNNVSGGDCTGTIVSNGNNLDSDNTCTFTELSDLPGVDPLLEPLQDNGGSTFTHALLFSSPAIDAGDAAFCPATDQRGAPRFSVCDMGAYEFEIYHVFLPVILNEPTPDDTTPPSDGCNKKVPVFTTDTAPTDGTLEFRVLFGEFGQIEGNTLRVWDVAAGQQINNDKVAVHAPKWVRVWWQPDGDSVWYLLPSQYWVGGGTVASEYGVSCGDAPVPTYHTSFGSAIPESEVPIFTLPLVLQQINIDG